MSRFRFVVSICKSGMAHLAFGFGAPLCALPRQPVKIVRSKRSVRDSSRIDRTKITHRIRSEAAGLYIFEEGNCIESFKYKAEMNKVNVYFTPQT